MADNDLPRSVKLTTDNDLDLSTGNLQIIGGLASVAQDVRLTLASFKGEWFLDREAGIPWFQDILKKAPDPNVMQAALRRALLARPGVIEVSELEFAQDRALRRLFITVRLNTDFGDLRIRTAL